MSYDFHLFYPQQPGNYLDQAIASFEEDEVESSPEADHIRQAVVEELKQLHPALEVRPHPDGFAFGCWVGNDRLDCGVPEIDIGIATASLSVGYGGQSVERFNRFRCVLAVFERHGFMVYDPQLDEVVTSNDLSRSSQLYEHTSNQMRKQFL